MALWYSLNSPLDFVLYGDRAASASPQRRRSMSPPVDRAMSAAGLVDVIENGAAYEFIADAPGFSPSDISVDLKGKVLTISGKQQQERKEQQQPAKEQDQQQQQQQQQQSEVSQPSEPEVKVLRSERRLRQFIRSFELPRDANTEDITASLDKGVLTVRVAAPSAQDCDQAHFSAGCGRTCVLTLSYEDSSAGTLAAAAGPWH